MSAALCERDPSLYAGSAADYVRGRGVHPGLVERLIDELGLDGCGRLLDVGCGPDSLPLLLAPLFEHALAGTPTLGCDCHAPLRRQCCLFEAELRELLAWAGPEGRFSEQVRQIAVDVWRV